MAQDSLALGIGQLDAELRRETEDELFLEIEQLLERAVGLGAGSHAAVAAYDHRRHPYRSVLCDRRDALYHPLGTQQTAHASGSSGIGAGTLRELQLVE